MSGEFLTRATIWVTIIAYTIGSVFFALSDRKRRLESTARIAWTIACASLFAHFICAFQYYHSWSHTHAYVETARQTEEVFRLNWGGGLFINYALLSVWIVDVALWWKNGLDSYRQRTRALVVAWHSFLIFIIFNATVIFKDGAVRWIGLLITVCLCVAWGRTLTQRWSNSVSLAKT
jgi:hypothetical protein